jgi:predicted GNAT family acetyltransferase
MPLNREIDRWNEDPEYSALPAPEKQAILENYFDKNLADSDFYNLHEGERAEIRSNFTSYHMPPEAPPAPIEQPPEETMREKIGRLGARTGEIAALGLRGAVRGAAEGLTTELPGMAGRAMEFVGAGLPGDITETMRETTAELGGDPSRVPDFSWGVLEEVGKDLGDWADAKKLQWFGPPKKRKGLERIVYEGAKMLPPSILPGAIVGKGIRVLSGVGKLVKASKAANIAGNAARAAELMDKANKAANMANNIASVATASMFGLSQAQQTRDTAEEQAVHLESQGKYEEAKKVRASGQGPAAIGTGVIEAAGEYYGTKYLGKLFGLDAAGVAKRGAKNIVKQFLKETLGVEVTTEVLQQAGQAGIEQITGIRPEADPIAEALDVVGPTVFMTLLTGGLSGAIDVAREPTDSINIIQGAKEEIAPEKEAVNVNLIKRKLKEFREEVTGPPPTAREAAETLVGPEAVQEELERERIEREGLPVPEEAGREQIERLGLRVPEIKPAEEAARVFEEELPPPTPAPSPPVPTALAEKEKIPDPEDIDAAAHEAATSPLNAVPQPTQAQKEAGTYKKGHVNIQGLDISIENPKGSKRTGKDSDGETWETTMKSHYGYIKGTVGKDKDHIDIFVGDSPKKDNVYVIDQINPDTGEFDEHKVLIGFDNMRAARKGYKENYERGWKGLGAITKVPIDEFKEWAKDKEKTKIPLKYEVPKDAARIRKHERRVLREKEKSLEKEKQPVTPPVKEEAVIPEQQEKGRPDIQRPEEARREARDRKRVLKKTRPSLGTSTNEVINNWQNAKFSSGEHIVGIVPGEGSFDWLYGKLYKLGRSEKGIAIREEATPTELNMVEKSIESGTLQIQREPVPGVIKGQGGQGTIAQAELDTVVLHQATGKPLQEKEKKPKEKYAVAKEGKYLLPIKNQDLTFSEELTGAHHGQKDLVLSAKRKDETIGYIEYSEFEGDPHISHVFVGEGERKKGVGSDLIKKLQEDYPNKEIKWGMLTPEGTALKAKLDKETGEVKQVKGEKKKYQVGKEEKPFQLPRTQELIESVFPGQEIKEMKTGYKVTLKNGLQVRIDRVAEIVPEPEALKAGYGKPALGEGLYIAGAYVRYPKDFKPSREKLGVLTEEGVTTQIKISTKAGKHVLHHESVHLLEDFGVITKQEAGRINRHIKQKGLWDKSKSAEENRAEWLADEVNKPAPTSKLGKLWNKIKEFVDNLVNKFGLRTVRGVVQEIKTGKIYEKEISKKAKATEQYALTVKRTGKPTEESEEQPGLLRRQWDELVYNMQDKFNYLNKAQMEAERKKLAELPEEQDAYLAETRYHGMAAAAIEDFQEEHVDPMLELMSSNDIDISEADEYLHARHAKEANARLKEINPDRPDNEALSGMTDNEADLILDHVNGLPNSESFKELGKMVDKVTKAHRDILLESGQESKETIKEWEDTYDFYVPLMREGKPGRIPRRGRGFDVRGKQKIRAGSRRGVVNVLAHTVANTEAAMVRAEKLKVARTFLEFARNNEGLWEIDKVEYTPSFDADGMIQYRSDPSVRWADNVMIVKEGGVNHRITFDESDHNAMRIASAMKNLDASDSGTIVRTLSKATRWLAMVNTSLNPEFIISNFFRDIQTAGYNMSDSAADKVRLKSFKDIKSSWRGIRDFQKGKKSTEWAKWYNRYRKAGAQVGWAEAYRDIIDRENKMIKDIKNMRPGKALTIKRGLNSVMKFIEQENTAVENAVRLSVFKNLIESGASEAKAASIAKELTVNFNRKGAMGQAINAFYLFYNASIQGSARIISAATTSPKVRKMMFGTVAFAAALDVINRAVGGVDDDGEDRYDKIAPWVKERNMIFMLPDEKGYVQIPLPWGYNIFHVMGQTAGEAITKKDFDPWDGASRIAGATISSFNPVGGEASIMQVLSPTLTDPIVQWAENKDWAGRKLRPDTNVFAPKPSSQTYWNSVREPSKAIAQKINELTGGDVIKPGKIDISPEAIDLAINTFTGSAGRFVGNLISAPIKLAKGEELESYEVPILRRVYGRVGKQALTQKFYENMDAVQLVKRQIKHYKGDRKKINEIKKQSPAEVEVIRYFARKSKEQRKKISSSTISRGLSKLRKKRNAAIKAGNREKVDELNFKIEMVMRKFNKRYLQYKRKE